MALERREVVDAALELLNRDGLDGVTLRRLAKELQVQAMSLYWYVRNKQDLLDEMANAILEAGFEGHPARLPDQPWQDWLADTAHTLREALLAWREGARVVVGASLNRAVRFADLSETMMDTLTGAGFDLMSARNVTLTVVHYTFGHVIEEQAFDAVGDVDEAILQELTERVPTVAAAIDEAEASGRTPKQLYDDGLRLIIWGVTPPGDPASGT
ncbi:TetR/AcrR family transcriptional regulator C-terminal domain-containing protein [Actinomadura litoris]|uniref:TetR/AcrR family transcriptional regulator C-terminal domain-containing protein n=1 Tax=Actinomadura litoris TaxID=2678616 RepID=UPI001FA7209A|nr:TetR/AcrR family transcriptional regulator C-terminal domain-containing protein [Actinomadura litoris]